MNLLIHLYPHTYAVSALPHSTIFYYTLINSLCICFYKCFFIKSVFFLLLISVFNEK